MERPDFFTLKNGDKAKLPFSRREHDILIIGKDSAENITKFPFGPEHNIIKG